MNLHSKSFPRLKAVLLPALMLSLPIAAQSSAPSGFYGLMDAVSQIGSVGFNVGAMVGVINFDGSGNVSGIATVKPWGLKLICKTQKRSLS